MYRSILPQPTQWPTSILCYTPGSMHAHACHTHACHAHATQKDVRAHLSAHTCHAARKHTLLWILSPRTQWQLPWIAPLWRHLFIPRTCSRHPPPPPGRTTHFQLWGVANPFCFMLGGPSTVPCCGRSLPHPTHHTPANRIKEYLSRVSRLSPATLRPARLRCPPHQGLHLRTR